ncbi:hypothetical protein RJT34_22599 [Clitoria ternatea]|uniref:Uncharacterized protein n=1 Tax=Clitoria ternatea TaxID=43366 RepID=A0AAN9IGF8_CLITE
MLHRCYWALQYSNSIEVVTLKLAWLSNCWEEIQNDLQQLRFQEYVEHSLRSLVMIMIHWSCSVIMGNS